MALMYGRVTQLIAGVIQFRTGNTFTGVLFSTFGAFWLSLFAIAELFLKDLPPAQVGHALGLFLYGFGIFTVWIAIASFRTNVVVVTALAGLAATLAVGRDLDWSQAAAGAEPADCVPVAATDPLYVLYTSGTTARPKGVVRDNGGHAVALRWSMGNIYDTGPGEVYWTASDVGWVVGHSYIVYAPLLTGCTTSMTRDQPRFGVGWAVHLAALAARRNWLRA